MLNNSTAEELSWMQQNWQTTYSNAFITEQMWKSLGKCGRVGMYAKKQYLVSTFVLKSKR